VGVSATGAAGATIPAHLFEAISMKVTSFNINITSEDPERLAAFYRDVVGLPPHPVMGKARSSRRVGALIDGHSGFTAPPRSRSVSSSTSSSRTCRGAGAAGGAGRALHPDGGTRDTGSVISTFLDPDGNYIQLPSFKPE
jgi:predicted enzyme related to lactoylglutathione lyase